MAKKISKKSFLNISPSQIGKMSHKDLRSLLQGARQLWNAQASTFKKYEGKVYSHSYEKMSEFYEEHGTEKMRKRGGIEEYYTTPQLPQRMSVNQIRMELFRLQEFFSSDTSTVPGARKVSSDMAKRIFGTGKSGRPKKNLSSDEWAMFWSIYEEYKKQRPADVQEQSNVVQQELGQIILEQINRRGEIIFSQGTLDELRDRFEHLSDWEMDVTYGEGSVLSGTRPT